MTVLRSRGIVPTVKPQSPLKTLKIVAIEPMTPAKTLDPSNRPSSPTPNSTPSAQNPNPKGYGSDSMSFSGTIRRRSLRLASKLDSGEIMKNVPVSNRKRKSVVAGDSRNCINESDFENVEREIGGNVKNGVLDLVVKKVGVKEKEGIDEGTMDLEKLVLVGEEVTVSTGLDNWGLSSELGSSCWRVLSATNGKGKVKKKLGSDIDSSVLELVVEDEREKAFLSLRSGTKIAKRRMEGICGGDGGSFVGVESDVGCENEGADNGKESERVSNGGSGESVVMNELQRDPKVDENGTPNGRRTSIRGKKGKGKLVNEALILNGVDLVELGLEPEAEKSIGNAVQDTACLSKNIDPKELEKNPNADESGTSVRTRRRLSRAEKGKERVVEVDFSLNGIDAMELDTKPKPKNLIDNAVLSSIRLAENIAFQGERQVIETTTRVSNTRRRDYKERFRDIARQNAARFAHFSSQEEEENHITNEAEREILPMEADRGTEDWPGPFSTAMKIIKDREMSVNVQQQNSSLNKSKPASVIWVPKKDQHPERPRQLVPSLQEICMGILAKNADAIASLDSVPDVLRHKLSQLLCDSRRMNSHILDLLVRGSPTEVRVRDCSWLTEEQLTRTFEGCDANNLTVLQLDQCGRCMPDYILFGTLARSSNSLPSLTTISLKGACRLSDVGLSALVSSTPALKSINLSQCSLLTFTGINTLADSLGLVLRELYLDDCQNIDPMLILPALKKLEHLEVLSLAGIQAVCDDFIREFVAVHGRNMKELVLADCTKLTDSSLKVIAETCSGLCALDLVNLCKLTDSAIGYLANGCRAIQTLKFCRNAFSDEAIAAFLENSGESLKELSLNNVVKVGENTAVSLAKRSRKLLSLDLSWCRNLTDETLGLIVDSCLSMRVLKLFGCTQITKVFLDGHSNPQVQIVGLKMSPILEHLKMPDPLEGPLHYSSVSSI